MPLGESEAGAASTAGYARCPVMTSSAPASMPARERQRRSGTPLVERERRSRDARVRVSRRGTMPGEVLERARDELRFAGDRRSDPFGRADRVGAEHPAEDERVRVGGDIGDDAEVHVRAARGDARRTGGECGARGSGERHPAVCRRSPPCPIRGAPHRRPPGRRRTAAGARGRDLPPSVRLSEAASPAHVVAHEDESRGARVDVGPQWRGSRPGACSMSSAAAFCSTVIEAMRSSTQAAIGSSGVGVGVGVARAPGCGVGSGAEAHPEAQPLIATISVAMRIGRAARVDRTSRVYAACPARG